MGIFQRRRGRGRGGGSEATSMVGETDRAILLRVALLSTLTIFQVGARSSDTELTTRLKYQNEPNSEQITSSCRDNPFYVNAKMGLSCPDYATMVCTDLGKVGFDDDDVDELLQNCPQSCRVAPCDDGAAADSQQPIMRSSRKAQTSSNPRRKQHSDGEQCFPGWDLECQDNPSFTTNVGFPCSAHVYLDCTMFQAIGFTEKQVFNIINNCPCSCKVECGTWTMSPTVSPTSSPTISQHPSSAPSSYPSVSPTSFPSETPSGVPSSRPTSFPSSTPSVFPSKSPSSHPTKMPSVAPSAVPSSAPTGAPSLNPTNMPSIAPTASPSSSPTHSSQPSHSPSSMPTASPSSQPSGLPTAFPSLSPSVAPSSAPTAKPSVSPSASPSSTPTQAPTPISSPMEMTFSIPLELTTSVPFLDNNGVRALENVLQTFLQLNQVETEPVEIIVSDVTLIDMIPRLTARERSRGLQTEKNPSETLSSSQVSSQASTQASSQASSQVSVKLRIQCDVFPWKPHRVDPTFQFVPRLLKGFDVDFNSFLDHLSRSSQTQMFRAPTMDLDADADFVATPRVDQSQETTSSNPRTFNPIPIIGYIVGGLAIAVLLFCLFLLFRRRKGRDKVEEDNKDVPAAARDVAISPRICYPLPGRAPQPSPYNAKDGLIQQNVQQNAAMSEMWQKQKTQGDIEFLDQYGNPMQGESEFSGNQTRQPERRSRQEEGAHKLPVIGNLRPSPKEPVTPRQYEPLDSESTDFPPDPPPSKVSGKPIKKTYSSRTRISF